MKNALRLKNAFSMLLRSVKKVQRNREIWKRGSNNSEYVVLSIKDYILRQEMYVNFYE